MVDGGVIISIDSKVCKKIRFVIKRVTHRRRKQAQTHWHQPSWSNNGNQRETTASTAQ